VVDADLLKQVLRAKDHRARAAATRVLSFWLAEVPDHERLLKKCIHDDHPRVRLEAVRAVSFLQGDDAVELALGVLDHDMDDYLQYTLDETMRRLEQ
jgi:HEAT repeat protein